MTDPEMLSWLREAVTARLELARSAIHDGGGEWHTGCSCKGECRDHPRCCRVTGGDLLIYDEGGHSVEQARHIAANDPRDTIARCEAELAILDEHYILTSGDRNPAYEEFAVVPWGAKGGKGDQGSGCVTCHYYAQGGVKGYGICRTARLLAAGYKHQPGWKAEWAA